MINYQIKNWLAEDNPAPLLVTSHSQATLDQAISIVSGASPDHLIVPADEKTIAIKNIRAALAASHHTSLTGGRVIIIPEAAKLTTPAANALLKVLEEPPSATRFLLTTRWSRRLLPTIRSRCQLVRLLLPTDNRTASDNEVNSPTGEEVLPKSLLERLGNSRKATPLTEVELHIISQTLGTLLREQGSTAELRRAFMRLRDYHFVTAQRGNIKLAKDVLLASLPQTEYNN